MLPIFRYADEASLAALAEEKKLRGVGEEFFLLFAMGSQFDHLIVQALERLGVFCLVADPATVTADEVRHLAPVGIIVSGGPASVHSEPPPFDGAIFNLGIPVLGICLGFQMWALHVGAKVAPAAKREFGTHQLRLVITDSPLFCGISENTSVLESHGDRIEDGELIAPLATTDNCPVAVGRRGVLWGVQFHPEVSDTVEGAKMLENFCLRICGAKNRFEAASAADRKVAELKAQIGDKRVLLALSGGTDSSVVAHLLGRAIDHAPGRIRGVYIKGIDRPDDEAGVQRHFGALPWLDLRVVDASDKFLAALAGKLAMPDKRLAMRSVYKPILEAEAAEFGAGFIAQGTLYTDISESGGGYGGGARKAQIKLHHNTDLGFALPELAPLADCVKDGARGIGRTLGVPESLLYRHPFPGPGLVVRVEGEVTAAKLAIARAADGIFIEELRAAGFYDVVWQAGAVVTSSSATCTKGDDAASGVVLALWAVTSVNGFTARWAELPPDFLRRVSTRLTNEIREIGAVVYRISDKPPATIEWG